MKEYKVGDKFIFISDTRVISGNVAFTKNKIYTIARFSKYIHSIEYSMLRDDGEYGLWWDSELEKNFRSIRQDRKEKLEKLKSL